MTLASPHTDADQMRHILVIRFGSLGDLCVLGWALAGLADRPGREKRHVTLVTKDAFAPLMENFRGIDEVVPLESSGMGDLVRLAKKLKQRNWDRIIDAHNILRGHLLLGMMRSRADRRLAKDTAARLAFMRFGKRSADLDRTMYDRFAELVAEPGQVAEPPGNILPPLSSLADEPPEQTGPPVLGLAPGAQWDTKRWPEDFFTDLMIQWLADHPDGQACIFLGPREESWFPGSGLASSARQDDRIDVESGKTIPEVASLVSRCTRLVTNDSGLLHVAEAVGTPVLAFFGPTVREFGYFPILPQSLVLESPLDCRPCSRNGKRPCHRGDLACLRDIKPKAALSVLAAVEGKP